MSKQINLSLDKFILSIYSICVFLYAILQSEISSQSYFLKMVILGSFVVLIIFGLIFKIKSQGKIALKEGTVLLLFAALLLYNIIFNGYENGTFFIIPFCYILKDSKMDDILKRYSFSIFLALIFVVGMTKLGILRNVVVINYMKSRQSLGFLWSTFGPNMFLSATLAYIAYKKEDIHIWQILLLFLTNTYLYRTTVTLAAYICANLCLLLALLGKIEKFRQIVNANKLARFLLSNIVLVIAALTIALQMYYNTHANGSIFWQELNKTTSYRLGLGQYAFTNYKVSLMGQHMTWRQDTAHNYFYLDSSYIGILFNCGVVMLILICFIMDSVSSYGVKSGNYYLVIAVTIFSIHCVSDPQMIDFRNNVFLMLFIPSLVRLRKIDSEKFNMRKRSSRMKTTLFCAR